MTADLSSSFPASFQKSATVFKVHDNFNPVQESDQNLWFMTKKNKNRLFKVLVGLSWRGLSILLVQSFEILFLNIYF
jgi:hypothetical protein